MPFGVEALSGTSVPAVVSTVGSLSVSEVAVSLAVEPLGYLGYIQLLHPVLVHPILDPGFSVGLSNPPPLPVFLPQIGLEVPVKVDLLVVLYLLNMSCLLRTSLRLST